MNIWTELPDHFTTLAPMEGVTDIVFRQVIAKAGRPDLFFTEFTNVSSYASEKGRENALDRLKIAKTDPPIIAQIWGKNPDHFAETAHALAALGFSGLDINMGCPDRHVNKAGGGAAMIKTPDLAVECINRAKDNTNLPVSVKTRLGFTYLDEYKTWLPLLFEQDLAALTVHLRTRKEMSKVPAHYELIPSILKLRDEISPDTKLVINGDIRDLPHANELWAKYPEVNGMMIGRGVFNNPFCFVAGDSRGGAPSRVEPKASEDGEDNGWQDPQLSKLKLLNYHLNLFDKYSPRPFDTLKHFFKVYINNFPGASDLRAELMACTSTTEVRSLLSTRFKNA